MKSPRNVICLFMTAILLSCSSQKNTGNAVFSEEIEPLLLFRAHDGNHEDRFSAPRNFSMDQEKNIYVFYYIHNYIQKFNPEGNLLLTFGGKGEEPGTFDHLMAVCVFGDRLYAVDSSATDIFDLEGRFLERRPYVEKAFCEFPEMDKEGRILGEHNLAEELEKALILRSADGSEEARLTGYPMTEFFPDLQKGEDFFLQDEYARSFEFNFDHDGNVIWANSDEFKVFRFREEKSEVLFTGELNPLPFPPDKINTMAKKRDEIRKKMPSLHSYVPEVYPVVLHLLVAPNRDIWVYVRSVEKTGFFVLSNSGNLKGFVSVAADFDMTSARCRIVEDRMYFMHTENRSPVFYWAHLPQAVSR